MVDITHLNTLRVPATATNLIEINTPENMKKISPEGDMMFLGTGSNVLFTKDFPGTIVKINLKGKKIISETDQDVLIEVAAGENWHDLVTWAVDHNLSGIENMALIPGTVGAAAVGNIAAHGQNQEDVFDSLEAYNLRGQEIEHFDKKNCKFGYRESVFKHLLKNRFLITAVRYRLSKIPHLDTSYHATRHASLLPTLQQIAKEPYTIKDVYNAIVKIRTEKLPDWHKIGTAGSFFKNPIITRKGFAEISEKVPDLLAYPTDKLLYTNPSDQEKRVKISIARVLDELGWRGKTIGHVSTWPNQALYIINQGNATGKEIHEYSETMRADVKKNFGLDLEYEVLIV